MGLKITQFIALLFTALALGAALAHLFELPNKMSLSRDDYLTVQQLYQGWALLGIVEVVLLFSVLGLAILVRNRQRPFLWTLVALLCTAGSLIVFFAFTLPVNQQTSNWTIAPGNWQQLRAQWEYSHATRAVLYLIVLGTLTTSVLITNE